MLAVMDMCGLWDCADDIGRFPAGELYEKMFFASRIVTQYKNPPEE